MNNLLYGVGYNSRGKHRVWVDGKSTSSYKKWRNMIQRCYCLKFQEKYPNYIGCSVDKRWHDYQCFAEWFNSHPYANQDYQLDKDILKSGNKIYSPETCCLVPQELNSLLSNTSAAKGVHPQGVSFNKPMGKYFASFKLKRVKHHLGYFDCPKKAHQAYVIAKEAYVKKKALEWKERIARDSFEALMEWTVSQ